MFMTLLRINKEHNWWVYGNPVLTVLRYNQTAFEMAVAVYIPTRQVWRTGVITSLLVLVINHLYECVCASCTRVCCLCVHVDIHVEDIVSPPSQALPQKQRVAILAGSSQSSQFLPVCPPMLVTDMHSHARNLNLDPSACHTSALIPWAFSPIPHLPFKSSSGVKVVSSHLALHFSNE